MTIESIVERSSGSEDENSDDDFDEQKRCNTFQQLRISPTPTGTGA